MPTGIRTVSSGFREKWSDWAEIFAKKRKFRQSDHFRETARDRPGYPVGIKKLQSHKKKQNPTEKINDLTKGLTKKYAVLY